MFEVIAFLVVFTMVIMAIGLIVLSIIVAKTYERKIDKIIERQSNSWVEEKESK